MASGWVSSEKGLFSVSAHRLSSLTEYPLSPTALTFFCTGATYLTALVHVPSTGEPAVLSESSGSEVRSRTVVAVTQCEFCFLSKSSMSMLRAQYAELNGRMLRFQVRSFILLGLSTVGLCLSRVGHKIGSLICNDGLRLAARGHQDDTSTAWQTEQAPGWATKEPGSAKRGKDEGAHDQNPG